MFMMQPRGLFKDPVDIMQNNSNFNNQEYQGQLDYLKTLNENQYKWTVKGLEDAGLNPILAINGGAHSATTAGNIGNYNRNSTDMLNSVGNILQTLVSFLMFKKLK